MDPSAAPNVGRMIVTLQENGTGRPLPSIEFDPVGRFTPGLIDHYQMLFYQRIEQAHAATRAASRASPPVSEVADVEDTAETKPARRRA
jgi:hypothetical protein